MRIPGLKLCRQTLRWLRSRFVDHGLILAYHRVADTAWDPFQLSVAPSRFAEHLEVLRGHCHPLPLAVLLRKLRDGDLPPRAVAITFDDGYAANLANAKPRLERDQIPATEFVTTGCMGREFWWDELTRMIDSAARLPERLRLTTAAGSHEWDFRSPGEARGTDEDGSRGEQILQSLYHFLLPLRSDERRQVMARLWEWSGAPSDQGPRHRGLEPEEVAELARDGLVDIGAHTVSHPLLPALPPAAQEAEIRRSKKDLEELLGAPIAGFAYPNGLLSRETVASVRAAGFRYACTSLEDVVRRRSDPFRLRRFWMPNWTGEEFSRWLHRWIHG